MSDNPEHDRNLAKLAIAQAAINEAVARLNTTAQRQLLGLRDLDPDLEPARQALCEALSIITGQVHSGNLTMVEQTRQAMAAFDKEYPGREINGPAE